MVRLSAALFLASVGLASALGATDFRLDVDLTGALFSRGEPGSQGWFRFAPRVTRHLSPRVVFIAAPVLEGDTHGDLDRDELYDDGDRDPQRALLRFERLSVGFDLGALTIEVGRQPLTWGRTDAINPTDNLTPRDWTDPLQEARLSPWALRANLETGRWEGELALVPRYAPSRLPRLGGRWAPLEPLAVPNPLFPSAGPPTLDVELVFRPPRFPAGTLENSQWGLRFGRRGGRAEWALSWYRGFDDAAHFDASFGDPDQERATLLLVVAPRFPRLEVAGADAVVLAGAWAWRAEVGHFHFPEGLDDDFLLWELDGEWTRGAWRFVAGYADSSGRDRAGGLAALSAATAGSPPAIGALSLDLGLLPAIFVHLGRSLPTEWELAVEATIGTEDGDSLVRLSGSWPASDSLRLAAELHLVSGSDGTFFGAWRGNDRLQLSARLSH